MQVQPIPLGGSLKAGGFGDGGVKGASVLKARARCPRHDHPQASPQRRYASGLEAATQSTRNGGIHEAGSSRDCSRDNPVYNDLPALCLVQSGVFIGDRTTWPRHFIAISHYSI